MDSASGLGLTIVILALIFGILMTGASPNVYLNISSILIVAGGTFGAVMLSYRLSKFIDAFKHIRWVFSKSTPDLFTTLDELTEMADIARKNGFLGLEDYEINDPFMAKGINLLIDGHDPDAIEFAMNRDILHTRQSNNNSIKVMNSFTELAPAMGMIGTLIGLVAMLIAMEDPKAIGPQMSVALLTTLYGALIANGITGPFANKLGERAEEIKHHMSLVRDGVMHIAKGDNPKMMMNLLAGYIGEDLSSKENENTQSKMDSEGA